MVNSWIRRLLPLALVMSLLVAGAWPLAATASPPAQDEPVYLRLRYATFDPLQGEPQIPNGQRIDAYPGDGSGLYIVQFEGPVQDGWKEQLLAAGARLFDYLPDYAFVVWMDGAARARVDGLAPVRWTGVFQPAYKISPSYDGTTMIRVRLMPGADLAGVEQSLAGIGLDKARVTGDKFDLFKADGDVTGLAALPQVLWIEKRPMYKTHNDEGTKIMGGATAWASGLNGSGMTITVADTGVDTGVDTAAAGDMHADLDNRFTNIASWPVGDDGCGGCCWNVGADDGADDVDSGHGSHVIGSVAGNGARSSGAIRGLAHQASLTFQAVEQYVNFTPYCEGMGYSDLYMLMGLPADLSTLFQQAWNWGSRIHSNSWGAEEAGEYTADAQAVDAFVQSHPQMTILYSAGNEGIDGNANGYVDEDSMGSPGTAKNAITSGASDNERNTGGLNPGGYCSTWYECWPSDFPTNPTRDDSISDKRQEMAAFSSRGPTDDGRIKPDVVAPGTNILSIRSSYAAGDGWGPYNSYYMYMGGTSMSNPLIAGAATLVREYYIEKRSHTPSAALVKATLINSAVDISGYGNASQEAGLPIPNNHEGWGRVDVGAATSGSRTFYDGATVGTGAQQTYAVPIDGSATPLKVSLVWSDAPGSTSAAKALVNDLNLVVEGPGGVSYLGNRFSGGWSATGGSADTTNNVENVYVQSPAVGNWTVRVMGYNVPSGPQPFALVITGQFGAPPAYDHRFYLPVVMRRYVTGGGIPAAPILQPISNADQDGSYTVVWTTSAGATSYLLQEDDNASFASPATAYSGSAASVAISGKADGVYYYRVNASNAHGTSGWSGTQSVTVATGPSGPTAGFWQEDETYDCAGCTEFYVLPGGTQVDEFAIYISVSGCGQFKITHTIPEGIGSGSFSFSGQFYGSGTFDTSTHASGQSGLSSFPISGCGTVSGGPWPYNAVWVDSSQPSAAGPDSVTVEKVEDTAGRQVFQATLDSE